MDDMNYVCQHARELSFLIDLIHRFAVAWNLRLNVSKSVIMPPCGRPLVVARDAIRGSVPMTTGFTFSLPLGVDVGPGAHLVKDKEISRVVLSLNFGFAWFLSKL